MAKVGLWVGSGLVLLGVVLGFVKQGVCGSVFQPRDYMQDAINSGGVAHDCATALDLTVPVWGLIGAGALVVLVCAVVASDDRLPRRQPVGE